MKFSIIVTVLIFQVFILPASFGQQQRDLTNPTEIINNAIKALGGKDYLLTIKTLYTDISTEMEGRQVDWITKVMLPNKGAFQIVYSNRIVYQDWFDGENGFEVVNGEKSKADDSEFKDKKFKRNIFDELDYVDTTLWKLELLGEQKINNEDCYKIKATLINGLVKILYISKTTFYTLRVDKVLNPEKDSFTTTTFSDYKKFGQLTFYSVMKFGDGDRLQTGKIVSMLMNEKITDNDFK